MKVTFKQLKIKDFKSIDNLTIDFQNDTVIKGANEVGKTTIADAISYCLTGKSSEGNATFGVIPVGMDGTVSPAVQLEVEMIDGESVRVATIARVYKAKMNKAKEFTGDYANVCFINGVKTGVKEFDNWIDSHICRKEIFNLLFDVKYFTENIPTTGKERPWEAQRRLLLSICPLKSDIELASSDDRYEKIAEELKRYDNASQLMQALKAKLSSINKDIEGFDVRVDALESAKSDVDVEKSYGAVDSIRGRMAEIAEEKEQIQKKLCEIPDNPDKIQQNAMREKLRELNRTLMETAMRVQKGESKHEQLTIELNDLLKQFNNIKDVCYACGQKLPESKVEEQKKDIKQRGVEKRKELKKVEELLKKVKAEDTSLRERITAIENDIEALSTSSTNPEKEKLQARFFEIDSEFARLGYELATEQSNIAKAEHNDSIEQQIIDLETKHKSDLNEKTNVMIEIDTCRDFITWKCKEAEESINGLFDGVTFNMFKKNKGNDEIRECCEIEWRAVPYGDLSYSTKFLVSLKIVQAFQAFYGVTLPILIDNAESIDWDNEAKDVQTIRLIKEEQRCPRCGGGTGRREKDGLWTCRRCKNRFEKKLFIE